VPLHSVCPVLMNARFPTGGDVTLLVVCLLTAGCIEKTARHPTNVAPPTLMTLRPVPAEVVPVVPESEVLAEALAEVQRNDLSAAIRRLEGVRESTARNRIATALVRNLAERDPRRAAALAETLPAGGTRMGGLEVAGRAFVRSDSAAAIEWARGLGDRSTAGAARRVIAEELIRTDARAAIDRITALPDDTAREEMLGFAAAAWVRHDAASAISWLRNLPDDERKQRLTTTMGFEIAQRNPNEAIALAETLPTGRNRWLLFSAIGQTWVATDSKAALGWAARLPAGEPRDAAFAGIETGLGVPSSRRVPSAPGMRGRGSRSSPRAAAPEWPEVASPAFAAWLATQLPGMSRDEAILEYVRQRGVLEPQAIGQWLASLPGSTTRDRAMEIYVDSLLVASSPAEAARYISSLPRSDRTDDMVEKTAERWLLTSPDAASAWIHQTPMPAERRERLLREAGQRR
jgi:hypothetical protein